MEKKQATFNEAAEAFEFLKGFIGKSQLLAMKEVCKGEEKQFMFDKMVEMAGRIQAMPKTGETDAQGNGAIVYLHYFRGNMDWHLTEKDSEPEQLQAFGLCDLGMGFPELGYVSIEELKGVRAELDLYFKPVSLASIQDKPLDRPHEKIALYGREYNCLAFSTDEETNKFCEVNPHYGVLKVEKDKVFVALNKDKGQPVRAKTLSGPMP